MVTGRDTDYLARARARDDAMPRDDALREAFPPLVAMTTKELWACVEAWASVAHPDKVAYVKEEKDASRVRRLIIRLIELRWEQEPEARATLPLLALHETGIVTTMRHKGTGIELRVNGRLAPRPWTWTFAELANFTRAVDLDSDAGFAMLVRAKHHLDLEHVP